MSGCTSSNNKAVGIAQNQCSGNSITGNTASSNGEEGITADNQSNGGQIAGNILTGNAISGGVGNIGIDFASGLSVSGNVIQNSMDGAVQTFWDDAKQLANAGYAMVAPLTEGHGTSYFKCHSSTCHTMKSLDS
ncbi:hypothetical protein WJX79_000659 [Trebouxia sp. C0005]